MSLPLRYVAFGALLLAVSACQQAQLIGQAERVRELPTAGSLVHDGGIVFAQSYPAPRLENPNLVPIFLGRTGENVSADDAKKLMTLTNGQKTGYLPEAGQTSVGVDRATGFALLSTTVDLATGATEKEGAGAGSPAEEARYELAGLSPDVPFFARRADASGRYDLLALPASVDLRAQMPPVRDQGARNTGVAMATAAMLDFLAARDPDLPIKHASPQFLNWRYQIEVKSKLVDERERVWSARDTYQTLFFSLLHIDGNPTPSADRPYVPALEGYVGEETCPYLVDLKALPPDTNVLQAAQAHLGAKLAQQVADHQPLTSQGAYFYRLKNDIASYKAALAGAQPIQLALPVYLPDWAHPDANRRYQLAEMSVDKAADATNLAYQAVLVVGYETDDAAPGGGWFIVRNSWGSTWGDGGHLRVSFRSMMDFGYGAHIAVAYAKPFDGVYDIFPPADAPAKRPELPPTTDTEAWGAYTDLTAAKEGATLQSVPVPPVPVTELGLPKELGNEGEAYVQDPKGFGSPMPGADGAVEPLDVAPGAVAPVSHPVVAAPDPVTPAPAAPSAAAPGPLPASTDAPAAAASP